MKNKLFFILLILPVLFGFTYWQKPFETDFVKKGSDGKTFEGKMLYNTKQVLMIVTKPDTQYFLMDKNGYEMYIPKDSSYYKEKGKMYLFDILTGDSTLIALSNKQNKLCGIAKNTIGIDSFYLYYNKKEMPESLIIFIPKEKHKFIFSNWKTLKTDTSFKIMKNK